MDITMIAITMIAFFMASFVKGLTGIGFSTICLGILAIFMDLSIAIPLVFLPSLISSIVVIVQAGSVTSIFKRFWVLLLSAFPGLLLGIYLLHQHQQSELPKTILGLTMLAYALWSLKVGEFRMNEHQEKRLALPIGLISGVVNGVTGSQIMPIMPYLLSCKLNRDEFIQAINLAFASNTMVMMIVFGKIGLFSQHAFLLSAVGIVPVFFGVFTGGRLRQKVSDKRYRQVVLLFMMVLGCALILR